MKKKLLAYFEVLGYEYEDIGSTSLDANDDYPRIVEKLIGKMKDDARAIVICGSGVGVSMAANKIDGVLCGLGINETQVRATREHDDINCLALASDYISEDQAKSMVRAFLETTFSGSDRYRRRVDEIKEIEKLQ